MKILAIAPHPDDETLGCGGTLLNHKMNNDELHWLIITEINTDNGWRQEVVDKRHDEINQISEFYKFSSINNLKYPTTKLDSIPINDLINGIVKVYNNISPEIIYMPYVNDVHTDHQIIAKALHSTLKWFRYPSLSKIMMYETLSETEFNFFNNSFRPNIYVDISKSIDQKIEAMKLYESEIETFPFPRSEHSIRSLASVRGSQSGFMSAEAFQLVFERIK